MSLVSVEGKEIKFDSISVIVQGAIIKSETKKCLESIRKHLPGAQIVLSTWENSDVVGLEYDTLVMNRDQGAKISSFKHNTFNNCNRMIVSTQSGIKKADQRHLLKLRSDLFLTNSDFLRYWDKFPIVNNDYKLFEHRILASSIYSREFAATEYGFPMLFRPSDFWFFGLTKDLEKYFDAPLQRDEEAIDWSFKYPNRIPYLGSIWRYSPEQHLCFNMVKRCFPHIEFYDTSDWNEKNIEQSQQILYNNFVFLGYHESGIYCEKHFKWMQKENDIHGLITFDKFQAKYKMYCDPHYECVYQIHSQDSSNDEPSQDKCYNNEDHQALNTNKSVLYKLFHLYWLRGKK